MPVCLLLLLQKGFSTACWAAFQQRFREMDMNRARGRQRGGEGPGCGRAQRVAPAKAAQRNVCICVCAPMCLSGQGTASLPHQRSTVDDLLPRLTTVGPHSHLSPYTDRSVGSWLLGEPTSPLSSLKQPAEPLKAYMLIYDLCEQSASQRLWTVIKLQHSLP